MRGELVMQVAASPAEKPTHMPPRPAHRSKQPPPESRLTHLHVPQVRDQRGRRHANHRLPHRRVKRARAARRHGQGAQDVAAGSDGDRQEAVEVGAADKGGQVVGEGAAGVLQVGEGVGRAGVV
jgi:hypothetical protein